MQDFRKLKVWQKAHRLALSVYAATERFPSDERFGLTSQVRRAAVSVPTNIAEGRARQGDREFRNFLNIAYGSAAEVEYLMILARDLGFLEAQQHDAIAANLDEIKGMLPTFMHKLAPEKLKADGCSLKVRSLLAA